MLRGEKAIEMKTGNEINRTDIQINDVFLKKGDILTIVVKGFQDDLIQCQMECGTTLFISLDVLRKHYVLFNRGSESEANAIMGFK